MKKVLTLTLASFMLSNIVLSPVYTVSANEIKNYISQVQNMNENDYVKKVMNLNDYGLQVFNEQLLQKSNGNFNDKSNEVLNKYAYEIVNELSKKSEYLKNSMSS